MPASVVLRRLVRAVLASVALAAAPALAAADSVSIVPDRDNTLYESGNGTISNGAGPSFFVGRTAQASNSIRRGLVRFDVAAAVPAGAVVTGATLRVSVSTTNVGPVAVGLHRVTADWGEGTSNAGENGGSGAPATTGDATWKHRFFSTTNWGTLGGTFVAGASATTALDQPGDFIFGSTAGMIADVQGWLDVPAGNFGWLLRGDESTQPTAKKIESRESATPDMRPLLTIEYTQPVPAESATWGRVKATYR